MLAALLLMPAGRASTRPRYGGTLRVELHASSIDLDPRHWKPGSPDSAITEHFAALLFDRLVSLDNYGRFQPQLAVEWSHDVSLKRWQFALRGGVKFSDGSPLTPADVAASISPCLSSGIQVTPSSNGLVLQSSAPIPDLPEQLASGRCFVFRETADGSLVGTGPFAIVPPASSNSSASTGSSAPPELPKFRFRAQDQCWAGRPFVDHIEVTLGVPNLGALFDLQLGRADLVLLSPEIVRRALQSGVRVWTSAPATLYLLLFDSASSSEQDLALRQGVSFSLDRATMAGVLLQKQAEPATSLLPQWLSGYAFLFEADMNLQRAEELRKSLPSSVASAAQPLLLRAEAPGDLPRLVAERVAVNARQSGFFIQTVARSSAQDAPAVKVPDGKVSLHLLAWRYTSLSPRAELESLVKAMHLEAGAEPMNLSSDPEQLYAAEQSLADRHEIVPLVAFPDYVGVGPAVRDWMPNSWGEWHLADVWLDRSEKSPASGAASATDGIASPGAHP
jgi:MarR-like DNA-binding transcriptional regulator SgrR of sgrS sRNA